MQLPLTHSLILHDSYSLSHDCDVTVTCFSLCSLLQQAPNLEVVGEGMEVEGVTMKYFHETAVVGGVVR